MNKDVYVKTKDLRAVMFPNKSESVSDGLRRSDHIKEYVSKIFSHKFHYQEDEQFDETEYTAIVSKIILTNKDRTGLWLIHDIDFDEISIPGGHVDKHDIEYTRETIQSDNPLLVLQQTLIRELCEELYGEPRSSRMYENYMGYGEAIIAENKDYAPLTYILDILYDRIAACRINRQVDPIRDLWYLYDFPGQASNTLSFYYVIECDIVSYYVRDGIPCGPDNFIWIDKDVWKRSRECTSVKELERFFGEPITPGKDTDIRFSVKYRPIIDAIFNTKELF